MKLLLEKNSGERKVDEGNFLWSAGPLRIYDQGLTFVKIQLWNDPVPGGALVATTSTNVYYD
jgi:hypothetical protein